MLVKTDATVVALPQNSGKGAAVRAGVAQAIGDYIFFTDADMPYSLDFIVQSKNHMHGCDVVCGKRIGDYPLFRSVASAAYNGIAQSMLKTSVDDLQCGIKGFTKSAAKKIFRVCKIDGFAFDTEVIFLARQMGLCIKQLNVNMHHQGNSKVKLVSDSIEMFRDVIKIKNNFKAGEYNLLQSFPR